MTESSIQGRTSFGGSPFYITFNKGEIYIPHQIQNKAIGVDGDLALILPEVLENLKQISKE